MVARPQGERRHEREDRRVGRDASGRRMPTRTRRRASLLANEVEPELRAAGVAFPIYGIDRGSGPHRSKGASGTVAPGNRPPPSSPHRGRCHLVGVMRLRARNSRCSGEHSRRSRAIRETRSDKPTGCQLTATCPPNENQPAPNEGEIRNPLRSLTSSWRCAEQFLRVPAEPCSRTRRS